MAKATNRKATSQEAVQEEKVELSPEAKLAHEEGKKVLDLLGGPVVDGASSKKKSSSAQAQLEGDAGAAGSKKKTATKAASKKAASKSAVKRSPAKEADLNRQGSTEASTAHTESGVTNDSQNNVLKTEENKEENNG